MPIEIDIRLHSEHKDPRFHIICAECGTDEVMFDATVSHGGVYFNTKKTKSVWCPRCEGEKPWKREEIICEPHPEQMGVYDH